MVHLIHFYILDFKEGGNFMKNKIITISFIISLFGMFFTNLIVKDIDISISERRKLAKFPEIKTEDLINGKNM